MFFAIMLAFIDTSELVPQHMTNRLQIDLSGSGVLDNETFIFHFDLKPSDDVAAIVLKSCERYIAVLQFERASTPHEILLFGKMSHFRVQGSSF
jgi:hypothetical protein